MNPEDQVLKEKVLLLLSRERELWGLRKKHARVSAWLAVAQALPEIASLRTSGAVYPTLSRALVTLLKLQDVALFEVAGDQIRFLGGRSRDPVARLEAEAAELLLAGAGICNDASEGPCRALGDAVGLYRFMWHRIVISESRVLLVAVGYTKDKASFYPVFEQAEFGHFVNMGQQLAVLLRNAALVEALETEKKALEELNESLEQRVTERTQELARANRTLATALETLQEKERRIDDDLEQARAFQQNTLPALPRSDRIAFAARVKPLDIVGGDVYDIAGIAAGRFRVLVADVTGHGVQASMRTIVLKAEYDRMKYDHDTPDTLLVALNDRLTKSFPGQELICTAVCFDIVFEGDAVRMRYVNAAHPPLLVLGHETREIYRDGSFLGLSLDIELEGVDVELAPGDWIFAYTDGLCDQVDSSGALFSVPNEARPAVDGVDDVEEALDRIFERFDSFRGAARLHDDLALVAMKIGPPFYGGS
jgi:serine phosphatase RsbU (regulator of sigma subunit)